MIVVKVELWPRGNEERKRSLGTATIANVGGDVRTGEYDFTLSQAGKQVRRWKEGHVSGFPRLRLGGWDLLYRVLRIAVGGRNRVDELFYDAPRDGDETLNAAGTGEE